ncbi:MAG TPA: alpha/beta hydrolase [Alphaproteobacteria bacterium]|jgi:pimeloyl-ACP methyl ester carboxylesterase|nr:alpha/beta hydrolase [Alphaproteobacteria bacterium]
MSATVVMIPGACCGAWCFDGLRQAFEARGHRVLTPELPYHDTAPGAEPDPRLAQCGLRDYADAIARELDALGAPPVLLGHSMGGLLAQLLAARGRASALMLLAPAAPWGILPSTPDEIVGAMGLMATGDFWNRAIVPVFEVAAETSLNCLSSERQREVFPRFVPESGKALFQSLFWMFDAEAASHVNAVNVTCPVLCVAGGRDRLTPPATVAKIAEKYAAMATTEEFPEAGHMLLLEDGWPEIAACCLDWLDGALPTN